MDEAAFTPRAPEAELERRGDGWLKRPDKLGKIGALTLTNDHVLFMQKKFASTAGSGVLPGLVARLLQLRSEKRAGGPQPVFALADVRAARPEMKRGRGEHWHFDLADGSTYSLGGRGLRKAWEQPIRRLLEERHGRTVGDDGEGGFTAE